MEFLTDLRKALESLSVYRGLLEKEPIKSLYKLACGGNFISDWCAFFNELCYARGEESLHGCINNMIKFDVNPFSQRCAQKEEISTMLENAVKHDLKVLAGVGKIEPRILIENECRGSDDEILRELPVWNPAYDTDLTYEMLCEFHIKNGYGEFAEHRAFVWRNGGLIPVNNFDSIRLSQLKNYEYQRKLAVDNAKAFLGGAPANNCLLYGDRGTGKSSTVKAILNEFKEEGLRLVEMPKSQLYCFPDLIEILAKQPLKFIIFIDDLSFASDDDSYAALKAVLEGGVAARPENTVIYATTNRRHLIKESFSARAGDDVHASDTMQESLSLSDRFGLIITFQNPDKKRYLEIVEAIARDEGIEPTEELLKGAERFALERAVRSPRCAKQYIDLIKSEISI